MKKENLPTFVKAVHCQDEVGDNGTLHIQGAVNTAQVRFAAMKQWLPRAHLEIARDRMALLKYVQKSETAVTGTQVVVKADFLTMDGALKKIAQYEMDMEVWSEQNKCYDFTKFAKQEYWTAVKKILLENPRSVALFTNPQMERAWVNTRSVWIELCKLDRQTDIVLENLPDEISEEEV